MTFWRGLLPSLILLCAAVLASRTAAAEAPEAPSSAAERLYDAARPRLLQIRTVLAAGGRQSALGSGFLVSSDGIAVTNYHVVSQYALEPATYRLEYTAADGGRGALALLAIDIANDIALVRLDHGVAASFAFDPRALGAGLPKGERLYALGNPFDLGFSIVEGTNNGPVTGGYNERIHFSGPINPGMSGGPTVTAEGRVAGINVAHALGGDSVSFLVPARFAAQLLEKARHGAAPPPETFRAEIGRQLRQWQERFYAAVGKAEFRASPAGPYMAPELALPWMNCWGHTNADAVPKPRAIVNSTTCNSDNTRLFVANDLSTGAIQLTHSYVKSVALNSFQFATYLSQQSRPASSGLLMLRVFGAFGGGRWYTPERCIEDFMTAGSAGPPLRAIWCARAYRGLDGLYDVSVTAVTQDKASEALVVRLRLDGIAYDTAMALGKRFLEAVRWPK